MLALLLVSALAADPPPVAPEEAHESREQTEPLQSVEPPPKVPTTTVTEPHVYGDDQKVGPYRQPEWTETRHFPGTRVFVAPPSATFEWWLENKTPFDGGEMRWRSMWEMSFGLGHRLQLDFYLRTEQFGEKPAYLESERVELRYAFADWGKIPGNPTLYLEWIRQETGPMRGEVKLLFGGDLTDRLYWGFNLFFERDLYGAAQGQEYGLNAGISYALLERTLSLGAEVQVELEDAKRHHGDPDSIEVLLGPSVVWHPVKHAHVLLVWFVGPAFERGSPTESRNGHSLMQPTLVAGWRF